jgi:coenzyme F420 biosynthesis associated uncharacterized protein
VSKPLHDIGRLGAFLVLGAVAGAGVRYYIETRARATEGQRPKSLVDWDQARNVALRVSQWEQAPVRDRAARREQYAALVQQSEPLIAEYLGVQLPQPVSRIYVFDRREWLEANFVSFEHIFRPIEEIYERNRSSQGAFSTMMGDINRQVLGAQLGVLLGFLARRVLGQYDLSLLSPEPMVQGALYFVEPNIGRVQTGLGLNDNDFRLWIALHETTHVFEFEAYPWVREHFNSLVYQYFEQLNDQLNVMGGNIGQLITRILQNRGSNQHWIELMLTPQQRQIFEQLQALMSLVEGYGNHIMNAIGEQLLPSFPRIEQRMEQRRQNRSLFDQVFFRVTGMDLKMAQYQQGEQFVNTVVQSHGIDFAARVWERAENLPTMDEIRNPQHWIARMGG